ncbi:hypothetical protein DMENIID0001_038560 [Sergentomyia squamirostris]
MRILLRSVHTAVVESNCEVPVFVQVIGRSHCTWVYFPLILYIFKQLQTPFKYLFKYLSGLSDSFKGKIAVECEDPVSLSVRLNYRFQEFGLIDYTSKWFSFLPTIISILTMKILTRTTGEIKRPPEQCHM